MVKQELYPVLLAGGAGIAAGAFLAEVLGDDVVSLVLQIMGIGLKRIEFAEISVLQQLGIPMILLAILTMITCISCSRIRKIDIAGNCNE